MKCVSEVHVSGSASKMFGSLRRVDKLSIDFDNAGGDDELRLDTVRGSGKRHDIRKMTRYLG